MKIYFITEVHDIHGMDCTYTHNKGFTTEEKAITFIESTYPNAIRNDDGKYPLRWVEGKDRIFLRTMDIE